MSAKSPLIGVWELESFTERGADGKAFDVWGRNPRGCITYLESGSMSVLFAGAARQRFSGPWQGVTAEQKAANYDAMVAYAGRYTDFGDRVVHHVEVCWIPNWEGRDLERLVTFLDDDRVLLQTPATRFGRPQPVQDVIVRRARTTR